MPKRTTPLANNCLYHIMSRGHNSVPIFRYHNDYQFFIQAFCYYQSDKLPLKFSKFRKLSISQRNDIIASLQYKKNFFVDIVSYCLMPNHFHFLLKQTKNDGILKFIRFLNNSYSHYFNLKYRRKGTLFESRFKAILIETEEQLVHVSRYIHLNPYTAFVVKNINDLLKYPFSSLNEFLRKNKDICQQELIWGQFSSLQKYKEFVLDQADYQRKLQMIKHQLLENEY